MMDALKATAILAFCIGANAAAIPQPRPDPQGIAPLSALGISAPIAALAPGSALPVLPAGPIIPGVNIPTPVASPPLATPPVIGLPVSGLPANLPIFKPLPFPNFPFPPVAIPSGAPPLSPPSLGGLFPVPSGLPILAPSGLPILPPSGLLPGGFGLGFLSSAVLPSGAIPTLVLPIPSGIFPSGAIPSGIFPSGAVPSGVVPSGVVPSDAVSSGYQPSGQPIPSSAASVPPAGDLGDLPQDGTPATPAQAGFLAKISSLVDSLTSVLAALKSSMDLPTSGLPGTSNILRNHNIKAIMSASNIPVTDSLALDKRQLSGLLGGLVPSVSSAAPTPSASVGLGSGSSALTGVLGSLTGGSSSPLAPVTGALSSVTGGSGSSSPLAPVTGALSSVTGGSGSSSPLAPVTGVLSGVTGGSSSPLAPVTGALSGVTGGSGSSSPLAPITGALSGVTGGSSSPLSSVTGALGSVPVVGSAASGLTSGSSPLGAITGSSSPLTGVLGTATNAINNVPVVGSTVSGALNPVTAGLGSLPVVGGLVSGLTPASLSAWPISSGIPGTDPVGSFSISIIATLLSLLKKDPLSLFGPSSPIAALSQRDLPELHRAGIPELAKRQLAGLPSLSAGIPGIGIGGLSGSNIPGVSPDLAYLVGSIAKNIAVPGGTGLGSVTGSILSVLNGVVPNFLFQLPVVQDSVPTFGVLQLLSTINPSKFGQLSGLTNLPALNSAVTGLPASDLSFLKTLPSSSDPTNLVTTIMALSDNMLSLPGNVSNLKASAAALALKNLGLSVPGLS